MKTLRHTGWFLAAIACCAGWLLFAQSRTADAERLWRHRNLGKALYENPTTQTQAVEQFRQALVLAPDSVRGGAARHVR